MGFGEVWSLVEKDQSIEKKFIQEYPNRTTWVIVDNSNVGFYLINQSCGNSQLLNLYAERFWKAIYYSGCNVMLVSDGYSNTKRSVLKLQRYLRTLVPSDREVHFRDLFSRFKSSSIQKNVEREAAEFYNNTKTFTKRKAAEEADDEIRRICNESHDSFFILSNDTSLILGINNQNVSIVNLSKVEIRRNGFLNRELLYGYRFTMGLIVRSLSNCVENELARRHVGYNGSRIRISTILLMSCILDKEYSGVNEIRVDCIMNCFQHFVGITENDHYSRLITAALIAMNYESSPYRPDFLEFNRFVTSIINSLRNRDGIFRLCYLSKRRESFIREDIEALERCDLVSICEELQGRYLRLVTLPPEVPIASLNKIRFSSQSKFDTAENIAHGIYFDVVLHSIDSLMDQIYVLNKLSLTNPNQEVVIPPNMSCEEFNQWLADLLLLDERVRNGNENRQYPRFYIARSCVVTPDNMTIGQLNNVVNELDLPQEGIVRDGNSSIGIQWSLYNRPIVVINDRPSNLKFCVEIEDLNENQAVAPGDSRFQSRYFNVLNKYSLPGFEDPVFNLNCRATLLLDVAQERVTGIDVIDRLLNPQSNSLDRIRNFWSVNCSDFFGESLSIAAKSADFVFTYLARSFTGLPMFSSTRMKGVINAVLLCPILCRNLSIGGTRRPHEALRDVKSLHMNLWRNGRRVTHDSAYWCDVIFTIVKQLQSVFKEIQVFLSIGLWFDSSCISRILDLNVDDQDELLQLLALVPVDEAHVFANLQINEGNANAPAINGRDVELVQQLYSLNDELLSIFMA